MANLPKVYEPQSIEDKWYKFWQNHGFFHADSTSDKPPYAIVIPPPNITGSLHVGHALDNTLQDCLIRWRRMEGYNVLWMPGTDHAGIVTELIMEQKLADEGTSRNELGRERFIERMWEWKDESADYIVSQLQQLGCSCDWERERFTLDDGLSEAVRTAFVNLFDQGLIYQDTYMVNWCPQCNTAVSNLEVEQIEIDGNFYHIHYPVVDSDIVLEIATTRPETMLGDTAVAVHPDDERYQHLIGKKVLLPLADREIPIIADSYVDTEFGTGALKVTPAHDPNDYEIGLRHDLTQLTIFTSDGYMNAEAGEDYAGLSRWKCRDRVVEDLEKSDRLVKIVPHRHAVGHHDRCDTVVEPSVSLQWFMNVRPLADRAIEATKKGEVQFIPERETSRFLHWMENIEPWPLSRQRWWGHRLPIWYCEACGKVSAAMEMPEECECGVTAFRQEEDVLDTWFSSGLWPFSTLGWPKETDELETFYPTSVLVSGWDILFFWVARMIMLGLGCMDEVPFRKVFLHGLVSDDKGQKMSKSKGNSIDPLDTIATYGTDAFRFALANISTPIPYVPLPESHIESGRRFANKVWNAARFILMNLEKFPVQDESEMSNSGQKLLEVQWIQSRLSHTIEAVTDAFESFRFYEAAQTSYAFLWHEFCDWYVELAKQRLTKDEPEALWVAAEVLEQMMRLLHPIMPFITEEIWQQLPRNGTDTDLTEAVSVTVAPFPKPKEKNSTAEATMSILMQVIDNIRSIRGELNVPIGASIDVFIQSPDKEVRSQLETYLGHFLPAFTRVEKIEIGETMVKPAASAEAVIGNLVIYVPLAGVIDFDAEKARLTKRHEQIVKDIVAAKKTLANPNFKERAPKEVVAQKQDLLERLNTEEDKLSRSLTMLSSS
ncbi:valine--tRNA ligase [Candidatus Poribacteria bacterium]|nr:valine--tRNA ligase [Candidatus Poribacteria bacterium]MYI94175.1 valine--tRNA ligase [Candidatus Poribacteria bacterium]